MGDLEGTFYQCAMHFLSSAFSGISMFISEEYNQNHIQEAWGLPLTEGLDF